MMWLTWRQHRRQALFTVATLAVLAALVIPTGLAMRDVFADTGLAECVRQQQTARVPGPCDRAFNQFSNQFGSMIGIGVLMLVVPLLIGLFWGAPLVAREVEHGTHRLVWTQGISRRRWAVVKVAIVGAITLAAATAYGLGMSWWLGPFSVVEGRMTGGFFDAQGVVPIAYTLFAVALGVFAGTVWPKMLPAMGVTLVGYFGVRLALSTLARPRYASPLERTFPVYASTPPTELTRDSWIVEAGVRDADGTLVDPNARVICPPGAKAPDGGPCGADLGLEAGAYNWQLYHPGSRFWPFQFIESGIYVALAALLLYLAMRRVRRIA
jgi:hypothetical protein